MQLNLKRFRSRHANRLHGFGRFPRERAGFAERFVESDKTFVARALLIGGQETIFPSENAERPFLIDLKEYRCNYS